MQKPTVTIEDIEANYDHIFGIVGTDSYVNWETFTKSSTDLNKQMEELMRGLSIYREIQQKRFLNTMKKLKSTDVPDLLKTVKTKKLPREALKAVLGKFQFDQEGKIKLAMTVNQLKAQSQDHFIQYASVNQELTNKFKEATDLVAVKIHESGLYQEAPVPKELVSTFKANYPQEVLDNIKKDAKIQYMPGTEIISFQTYGTIVHNTYPLVKDEYKRLTLESRENQRELMGDHKKYVEALIQYLTNTEALILDGQRLAAKAIGLEQKKVEESEVYLMEKGLAQTILLIQSGLRTTIKQSIVAKNEVNFDTTQKIIKTQIQLVKQKTPFFKAMLSGLDKSPENFQVIPLIIALTLNDFIFETYKLEEEDFMKAVTDQTLLNNPEVSNLFKEMEKAIIVLMKECEIINEDMAKAIEMQSQQIQGHLGDISQGMGQNPMGGVLPGSNPIELLQQQQRQQFQQMMQKNKKSQ